MDDTRTRRTRRPRLAAAVGVAAAAAVIGVAGSMVVADDDAPRRPAHEEAVDAAELEAWARSQHLTGLSAAMLTWTERRARAAELEAIEDWARSQGLTGLSPASLQPSGD